MGGSSSAILGTSTYRLEIYYGSWQDLFLQSEHAYGPKHKYGTSDSLKFIFLQLSNNTLTLSLDFFTVPRDGHKRTI